MPLVPEEDARLVRHIRKQKQRMEKRKHTPVVKKTHEGFDMLFGTDDKSVRCHFGQYLKKFQDSQEAKQSVRIASDATLSHVSL